MKASDMRMLTVLVLTLLTAPPALACDDHDHGAKKGKAVASPESAWVAGEVREVDLDESTITLGHAKIAALKMAAMESMTFKAADRKVIANAKPGDKVKFRARLVDEQPTVTRLAAAPTQAPRPAAALPQ